MEAIGILAESSRTDPYSELRIGQAHWLNSISVLSVLQEYKSGGSEDGPVPARAPYGDGIGIRW